MKHDIETIQDLCKKIAQYRKSQCWLCHKLELALDELVMELVRRCDDGVDSNTVDDSTRDDGWSVPETVKKIRDSSRFYNR